MTRIWFWAYVQPEGLRCDFCKKKKLRKKKGFVMVAKPTIDPKGVRGFALAVWTFMLRYFRKINILGFILYSAKLL